MLIRPDNTMISNSEMLVELLAVSIYAVLTAPFWTVRMLFNCGRRQKNW